MADFDPDSLFISEDELDFLDDDEWLDPSEGDWFDFLDAHALREETYQRCLNENALNAYPLTQEDEQMIEGSVSSLAARIHARQGEQDG